VYFAYVTIGSRSQGLQSSQKNRKSRLDVADLRGRVITAKHDRSGQSFEGGIVSLGVYHTHAVVLEYERLA